MRTRPTRAIGASVALIVGIVVGTGTADAAGHDRSGTVSAAAPVYEWDGPVQTATNFGYDSGTGGPCGSTVDAYCDVTLVHVDVDPSHWDSHDGALVVSVGDYDPNPAADFDVYIYRSDPGAGRGALVDDATAPPGAPEAVTVLEPSGYYLVHVVYFTTVASGYHGHAMLTGEASPPPGPVQYWFHRGEVPVHHVDKLVGAEPRYDTNPPTSTASAVAPDTSLVSNTTSSGIGSPAWKGVINGSVNTVEVDFWQASPPDQLVPGEVSFHVILWVGATDRRELGTVTVAAPPDGTPTRVQHLFTPENTGRVLPFEPGDRPVTIEIGGTYLDDEVASAILYDSVEHPSGFSVNVPAPSTRGAPPDVDVPAGLQEHLASDPSHGFRSHSEPHIARSPLDPDLLVAGSKMYNRDPDSLKEYEFKIGTYVSFDGGRTWSDLGQLAICPLEEAPPESWPYNTCYPDEDPTLGGLDADEEGEDIGEEYITSDVWVDFDDEGNAYVMVLDHPPYNLDPDGSGWGMSFHRWESVSPEDLLTGNTWGPRTPINAYADATTQTLFLDDKNTFAVNNAGPDRDGEPGIIVACWGLTVNPAKQQIVCERSTDGGRSWPDLPVPISDAQPLVIGVHVIADVSDPNRFHATWLQYGTSGVEGLPATLEYATTLDGGLTWVRRPLPVTTFRDIPRQFPGQRFRNLSIPIMAEGPGGDLYVTYAAYLPAPDPANDEDGWQADIMVVRSADGGLTWDRPTNVTLDTGFGTNRNADQFQPYVAVTESGQVNVAYFDRRMDLRRPDHVGNYYVDVWLSRSSDRGGTFSDIRLSHDMSDPERNAPVSRSGLFFGDYQGLVADDCTAVAFFNDSHLGNPPGADSNFDDALPRSPYQEVVAWVVPNTTSYGGSRAAPCEPDLTVDS